MQRGITQMNNVSLESDQMKNLLVLVIDVNVLAWCEGVKIKIEKNTTEIIKLADFLKSLFNFFRLYCFMGNSERLCIIATCSKTSKIIFENYVKHTKGFFTDADFCQEIYEDLIHFIKENTNDKLKESTLSSALMIGLCYINRIKILYDSKITSRLFLLDVSEPHFYTKQYTQLMNIAYNAKRNNIIIDVFSLTDKTTVLEQMCNITSGLYIDNSTFANINCGRNKMEEILTQLMIFWYLPSNNSRKFFSNTYVNDDTNLAVCSCHNKQIDIAYICSCCLTIYCSEKDTQTNKDRMFCINCKTRFTKSLLRQKILSDLDFMTL